MRRSSSFPLALLLLAAACGPPTGAGTIATVDTAAVRTALDSFRMRYIALETAGDAAGLAALYAENAGIDLYGLPRLRGRASIEEAFQGLFATRKVAVLEINPTGMEARTNSDASELGTFHTLSDSSGVKLHEWGRYLVAFVKDSTSQWRLIYLIGFPDSTKVEK
jgi:ketosteroid isomerase-like protein